MDYNSPMQISTSVRRILKFYARCMVALAALDIFAFGLLAAIYASFSLVSVAFHACIAFPAEKLSPLLSFGCLLFFALSLFLVIQLLRKKRSGQIGVAIYGTMKIAFGFYQLLSAHPFPYKQTNPFIGILWGCVCIAGAYCSWKLARHRLLAQLAR